MNAGDWNPVWAPSVALHPDPQDAVRAVHRAVRAYDLTCEFDPRQGTADAYLTQLTPLRPTDKRIIEHMGDTGRAESGEEGLVDVPLRPKPHSAPLQRRCLRGHLREVAHGTGGYSHIDGLQIFSCDICHELGDPKNTWCLVDITHQHIAKPDPQDYRLRLEVIPPETRGGVGRIQLRRYGLIRGDLDMTACAPCRRAVLENIRVDEDSRRNGIATVLLAAAFVRAPPTQYDWSSTAITDTLEARAFWAVTEFPGTLGTPHYCTDMQRANGLLP